MLHVLPDSVWPPNGVELMSAHDQLVGQTSPGGGYSVALIATLSSVTDSPVPWRCDVMPKPASDPMPPIAIVDAGIALHVAPSLD